MTFSLSPFHISDLIFGYLVSFIAKLSELFLGPLISLDVLNEVFYFDSHHLAVLRQAPGACSVLPAIECIFPAQHLSFAGYHYPDFAAILSLI